MWKKDNLEHFILRGIFARFKHEMGQQAVFSNSISVVDVNGTWEAYLWEFEMGHGLLRFSEALEFYHFLFMVGIALLGWLSREGGSSELERAERWQFRTHNIS